ncbi:hypothetical protein HNY73_007469 [Argiope bruennichi]|uniref:Uncharacterized protein n=1 Tax=Argiope bruennichi TaxID=94029 RepID=A0A8T0FH32_ARGBR|nr:hypothetical protein HNY73_007469 [Argiope bruennichi]
MRPQPSIDEFRMDQGFHSSEQQCAESDINRMQGAYSLSHHQSGNEPIVSGVSQTLALQQQQKQRFAEGDINRMQGAYSLPHHQSGNEPIVSGGSQTFALQQHKYTSALITSMLGYPAQPVPEMNLALFGSKTPECLLPIISETVKCLCLCILSKDQKSFESHILKDRDNLEEVKVQSETLISGKPFFTEGFFPKHSPVRWIPNELIMYRDWHSVAQQSLDGDKRKILSVHPHSQCFAQTP